MSITIWRIPAPHAGESEEIVDEVAGVLDRREDRLKVALTLSRDEPDLLWSICEKTANMPQRCP